MLRNNFSTSIIYIVKILKIIVKNTFYRVCVCVCVHVVYVVEYYFMIC